ncbi:MAG: CoA pyrophosphatase [Deferribacterales bacterium]
MNDLIHNLRKKLQSLPPTSRKIDTTRYNKEAAVLIPIVNIDNKYHLIFTKRDGNLKNHSGEISFPGGRYDENDGDLIQTVLREVKEEIGIPEKSVEIIGKLPQEYSVTYFRVTPFIGYIDNFTIDMIDIDKNEVNELIIIPLNFFLNSKNSWREVWLRNEEKHINIFYNYNGTIIWGLTGRITYAFIRVYKSCGKKCLNYIKPYFFLLY